MYLHFFYFGVIGATGLWFVYTQTVTICSVVHNFLPPWEFLKEFPRAQRWYRLLVYLVGWVALNQRSTMYPSISTEDGKFTSQAALKGEGK